MRESFARPRRVLLLVMSAVALGIGGCASKKPAIAEGGPIKVVATTSFLADIAQNVAGSRLTIRSLLPPGANPHAYQPTPRDAAALAQSQLLIVNGLGYETWLKNLMGASQLQATMITATDGVQAIGGDPHMWMNPLNVVQYTNNIRDGLSEADPAGAAEYAANASTYITSLKTLDAWIKTRVSQVPSEKRVLVTNHDELGYFAQAYGFQILGAVIPSVTSEAAPSAQQMAQLIQTVKTSKAPAIFVDINENQNLARQIASETGAKVITDLYVESLSPGNGPASTYLDMLRYDAVTIVDALK